jgi:hypothetical protein
MEADANGRRFVVDHQVIGNPKAEDDRVARIRNPQHERIPDGLDVLPLHGVQLSFHRFRELRDESERRLISVRLRERGEAGDVGEGEGGGWVAHRIWKLLVLKILSQCPGATESAALRMINRPRPQQTPDDEAGLARAITTTS